MLAVRACRSPVCADRAGVQLLLAIDAIKLLAVHHMLFPNQEPTQAPVAKAPPLRAANSRSRWRTVESSWPFRLIVQARAVQSHQPACAHLAHCILLDEPCGSCASRRRL